MELPPVVATAPSIATARATAAARLAPAQHRSARRCLLVLGVLSTGTMLGSWSSLYLVNHYPLLLIGLSPISRHLILVAPTVNPVAFVVVAAVRRMAFYVTCFFLGRALGSAALEWLEERAPRAHRFVRLVERLFDRAQHLCALAIPGPIVSTLAGSANMSLRVFAALALAGTVVRLCLFLLFGEWFREPIEALLAWIDANWVAGSVVLVAAFAAYHLARAVRIRRARST